MSSSATLIGNPSSSASGSGNGSATASPGNRTPAQTRAQAEARAAVLGSLHAAGSSYDREFQQRAADLHANAAAIAKQQAQLKKNTAALAKETTRWQKEVDRATKGLNEFGDLQNWAEMMERDFCVLEETLRLAEGAGERIESASGGSEWRIPQ